MKPTVLYLCYYNIAEPLVQTQVLGYLRGLARAGHRIHLLTFEKDRLPDPVEQSIRAGLDADGITWWVRRSRGSSSLIAKVYDALVGALSAGWLCVRYRVGLVHARSHLAAAMALPLKAVLGCSLLFDVRGLLAEEYVDIGHWRSGELKFRLTKIVERLLFRHADGFIVLTQRIRNELVTQPALRHRPGDMRVIPCCVDTARFTVAPDERRRYRQARGWEDRLVLTYVGKVGTWYLSAELVEFFAHAVKDEPRFFLQVLTQSDPSGLQASLRQAGVRPDDYDIRFVPPEQLPIVLGSSDAGVSFIKPCPSKRASSPTKVGEYLAAGLPVLANGGIGDCDELLENYQVGVVLADFSANAYRSAATRLRAVIGSPQVAARCRTCADQELSLSRVGVPGYAGFYDRLLGTPQRWPTALVPPRE
jgi:glycosyltransferase involved in cell wall biosynthesis